MGYHAASSGNLVSTFWDKRSVPSSRDPCLNMEHIGCHETSARNYGYSLYNNPEERGSQFVPSAKHENVQTGAFHHRNDN